MTPLLALLVSLRFEGFRPDLADLSPAPALAVAGNALMLSPGTLRSSAGGQGGAPEAG